MCRGLLCRRLLGAESVVPPRRRAAKVPGANSLRGGAGHDARRLEVRAGVRRSRRRLRQRLRVSSRAESRPDRGLQPRWKVPSLLGQGPVRQPPRDSHRQARPRLDHRHSESPGDGIHQRGQVAALVGDEGKGRHDPRHVQPANRHRVPAQRRLLRDRRLRQLARGQVLTGRQVPDGMGQARDGSGRVRPASRHRASTPSRTFTSATARTTASRSSMRTASFCGSGPISGPRRAWISTPRTNSGS